jgi:hypothetical protein
MMLPDGQEIEAGAIKLTAEDGRVFFRKEGQIYDADGNHVKSREIRGVILGGICGHPTCHCGNARWRDHTLEGDLLVCDDCASEKNRRAEGLRTPQPCEKIEP